MPELLDSQLAVTFDFQSLPELSQLVAGWPVESCGCYHCLDSSLLVNACLPGMHIYRKVMVFTTMLRM